MSKIMTVLGPIAPEELGYTSMHEHIMFYGGKLHEQVKDAFPPDSRISYDEKTSLQNVGLLRRNFAMLPESMDLDDEDAMCGEVQDFKDSGGSAMVEMSAIGIRLDVAAVKRISQKTGVHVVQSTGFYVENKWPDDKYRHWELEQFRAFMLNEIENGIEDTGVFPGHLKIGIAALNPPEVKALRAAVQVSKLTGLSLTVHPSHRIGGDVRTIVKIAKAEGMDLSRLVIAHMGGTVGSENMYKLIRHPEEHNLKLDYCHDILDTGTNICFELLGNELGLEYLGDTSVPDWMKLAGLRKLINEGYAGQIVMGTDMCVKMMGRRYGGQGYCRLTQYGIPLLQQYGGVSEYAIHQITTGNPARILAY